MGDAIASAFVEVGLRDTGLRRGMADVRNEVTGLQTAVGRIIPQVGMLQNALRLGAVGGAVLLTAELGRTIWTMGEAGAAALRMQGAFSNLWSVAGDGGERALTRLRAASADTISDMDLMAAASRAAMLGVTTNIEQLAALLEIARDRAQYFGISTADAFDSMVLGIGRLSPQILDNIGLTVDAERTFQDYADSIGVSVSQLSRAEKVQALVARTIAEGQEAVEGASAAGRDAAGNYEAFAAQVTNLKEEFNKLVAEAIGPYVGALAEALKATRELFGDPVENIAQRVVAAGGGLRDFQAAYDRFIESQRSTVPDPLGLNRLIDYLLPQSKLSLAELEAIYNRVAAQAATANDEVNRMDPTAVDRTRQAVKELEDAYRSLAGAARVSLGEVADTFEGEITNVIERYGEMVARGEIGRDVANLRIAALRSVAQSYIATMGDRELADVDRLWLYETLTRAVDEAEAPLDAAEARIGERGRSVATVMRNEMQGIVEGVFRPTFAGDPTNMLDQLGLHIDTADEGARRLASVMAEGLTSEWTQYFADKGLLKPDDLISDDTVRAAAARLLRLQQFGPIEGLFDREAAIAQVQEIVAGKARMNALVADILSDPRIAGLGVSRTDVAAALGDPAAQAKQVAADVSAQVSQLPPISISAQATVGLDTLTASAVSIWQQAAQGLFATDTAALWATVALKRLIPANVLDFAIDAAPLLSHINLVMAVDPVLTAIDQAKKDEWAALVPGLSAPVTLANLVPADVLAWATAQEPTLSALTLQLAATPVLSVPDAATWNALLPGLTAQAAIELANLTPAGVLTWAVNQETTLANLLLRVPAELALSASWSTDLATALATDPAANGEATMGTDLALLGTTMGGYITGGFSDVAYVSPLAQAIMDDYNTNKDLLDPVGDLLGLHIAKRISDTVKNNVNLVQGVVDAAVQQMAEGLIEQANQSGQ